ncbi:Aste57867_1447 [Aphanomyces stellatus]|uniref:Aste57867_1447 protein n=1 Tax=Aphanomyces stellatus TaxID=120398 RepID=A0A485K9E7_9STRA|nr:hypothetical protein As57867_001446 [Aphanomyces stellatus]VFT78664.1 Aste57867_1447 [Aphanomyces stellatus]
MSSVKESTTKPSASDFTLERELGQGNFSKVYLARHKATQETFAVKLIEKARIMRMKIRHPNIFNEVNMEKTVLNMLRHPNIIRLYHTYQDASNLYYLMEYVENGELWDALNFQGKQIGCTEPLAQFYAADMVNALEYMASRHIVHRDLKPENMIVGKDDGHIRIVDFGTAKNLSDISLNGPNFVGTPEYMSPETIENQSVDCTSDLWALGCILYQLLAGETPFQGGSPYLTFLRVKAGTYDVPGFFSPDAVDLLAQLLQKDPKARPSFARIKAHAFFRGIDFQQHMTKTPPAPAPDDRFILDAGREIAAYVQASDSNAVPDVLVHAATLPLRARLMHVLNRMQLLHHHLVYPRFFASPALGRCLYATKRGYVGYIHGTQNQWAKPFHFVHLSGPQVGKSNTVDEVNALEQVLVTINALQPAFVVFSGNMTHASPGDKAYAHQVAAFQTALDATLDASIRVVFVTGSQDVGAGESMSEGSVQQYTQHFGDDFYSFWVGGVKCIVLNSNLIGHKGVLAERALVQEHWLQEELEHGALCAHHICVFSHHPFFLDKADEDTVAVAPDHGNNDLFQPLLSWNLPRETRLPYVKMLAEAEVGGLFSGHFHTTQATRVTWPPKNEDDDGTVCAVAVANSFGESCDPETTQSMKPKLVVQHVHVEQEGLKVSTHLVTN